MTEYVLIVCLLSATVWAVFATWKVWGWGEQFDFPEQTGQGQDQIAKDLGIDDEIEEGRNPTTTVVTPPSLTNNGGTFTVNNPTSTSHLGVRYMGANAGLATVSSLWLRVRATDGTISDIQMTTNNTGAARDLVVDRTLNVGEQISFFLRVKPQAWSSSYYDFMNSRGRLTGTGANAYYDVFSSNSTNPATMVSQITNYGANDAGNVMHHGNEYNVGFEDLALDYSGCDRDYNDAEMRIAFWDVATP